MIDWSQIISSFGVVTTIIVTIVTAVRWLDSRMELINEKSEIRHNNIIKEWREEHKNQMQENECHWRELFVHFNSRLDKSIEKT